MSNTGPNDGAGEKQLGPTGVEFQRQEALLKTGALQSAIFNSANFSSIATDAKGVIQNKLKADPDTRDICVVAVTCYPERYPKAAALAAGCDAYLLKPIDTRKLSDQLTAVAEGGIP